MGLRNRILLGLVAIIGGLLAVQSILHAQRIVALHSRELREDLVVLAQSLGAAANNLVAVTDADRAREYVQDFDRRRPNAEVHWLENLSGSDITAEERLALAAGNATAPRELTSPPDTLQCLVPVGGDEAGTSYLRIRRRVSAPAFLESILWTQLVTVAVLIVLCAALLHFLVSRFIARPVELLLEQARRVGEGNFATRTPLADRRDELGALARQMNEMTERLAGAHTAVKEERRARTKALEQLRHADRLSTVGKIASGIAHELGTPLNVVSGRAGMLAEDATDEDSKENAEVILSQVKHMTGIIRQLLDFSRRRGLATERVNIHDVAEQAVSLLEPSAENHDITLQIEGDESSEAELDAGKVLQVVTNLMTNAIQAMPDGGTLTLAYEPVTVESPPDKHADGGDYVRLEIRDTGVGIPKEDQEKIFDAFFTTKEEGKGTGLGLSVCHGIVREHGGWIELESEPGQGTSFFVYLPLA